MTEPGRMHLAATTATVVAFLMIAMQVAAKATRDALFLSNFDVTSLPTMLIASSIVSIIAVLAVARLMQRYGPQRLVPAAFGVSASLLFFEWWLTLHHPEIAAVALYLHVAVFGSMLISGFWSIANERFDPRSGKRLISRIATGGTLGGLAGGVLAERVASGLSVSAMLPILGSLHIACTGLLIWFAATQPRAEYSENRRPEDERVYESSVRILSGQPYLRSLAALVLVATICAALIDYVFKAEASNAYTQGPELLRFFAIYYTAVGLITVLLQGGLSRIILEKIGVTRTASLLPATLSLGALANLILPAMPTVTIARGAEAVLRNSVYRSSYELLFTPVPIKEKRATKSIIDVGFDRLGDAAGGGIVRIILFLGPQLAQPVMLAAALALGLCGLLIGRVLHQGYIRSLERSLRRKAVELNLEDVEDRTTRQTLVETMAALDVRSLQAAVAQRAPAPGAEAHPTLTNRPVRSRDPLIEMIEELRSGAPQRVLKQLNKGELDPALTPHLIQLLAWDEVTREVIVTLRNMAPKVTGQLVDHLLDPDQDFSIRRRIPRSLAGAPTQRAVDGLLEGMADSRFEVRFQCGRAISSIVEANPGIRLPREKVLSIIEKEVTVDRSVWHSQRLLDQFEETQGTESSVDEFVRNRASRSLEHVFTMLSLILPRQPLRIAYRGLHTEDANLKGTALEYLESVLPEGLRQSLWPFLEDSRTEKGTKKTRQEVLQELISSNQSIEISLEALRKKV